MAIKAGAGCLLRLPHLTCDGLYAQGKGRCGVALARRPENERAVMGVNASKVHGVRHPRCRELKSPKQTK